MQNVQPLAVQSALLLISEQATAIWTENIMVHIALPRRQQVPNYIWHLRSWSWMWIWQGVLVQRRKYACGRVLLTLGSISKEKYWNFTFQMFSAMLRNNPQSKIQTEPFTHLSTVFGIVVHAIVNKLLRVSYKNLPTKDCLQVELIFLWILRWCGLFEKTIGPCKIYKMLFENWKLSVIFSTEIVVHPRTSTPPNCY